MLSTDRSEFDAQLVMLCAGFNVPVGERSAAYWKGLAKMELLTFARVVEECLGENGPEKFPTVGVCWNVSKKMRAARYTPVAESKESQWKGDKWDIEANFHLLNHIRRHPKRYAPDSTYDGRQAVPGPLTKAFTEIVVRWKKTWAEDMRAEANPTAAIRQASWHDCMARADAQIAERAA